ATRRDAEATLWPSLDAVKSPDGVTISPLKWRILRPQRRRPFQHHRVALRHRTPPPASHQRGGVTDGGADNGLEVARHGVRELAKGERLGTPPACARRHSLRRWCAAENEARCWRSEGERRLTHAADPQPLTISRSCAKLRQLPRRYFVGLQVSRP